MKTECYYKKGEEFVNDVEKQCLWYAIKTKPRCEKKLSGWLRSQEIEHYLPLHESVKVYARKTVKFLVPVFSGYLFARFERNKRKSIQCCDYTCKVLDVWDQEKFIWEMEQVKILINSGVPFFRHSYLRVGKRVKIVSGKLVGLEGIVEEIGAQNRLVISVDMFQQSVCVEINGNYLEIID